MAEMNFEEWCRANKPSILDEFYPESNVGRLLSSFSKSSKETAIWRCKKGHGWYATVYGRQHADCPICSNRVIVPGINDLLHLRDDLAKEYIDPKKKVDRVGINSHHIA